MGEIESKNLRQLNQIISRCRKCPLFKTRHKAVPGAGPVGASFMFVGQAPGREEDKIGQPFVGQAGKFLNHLLAIASLSRDEVFLTSIVKCFPPKNRKPNSEEIKRCFPYLQRQIDLVKPQKIILLGEVAFKTFFPNKKLKNYRGQWLNFQRKKFFATYHPSAGRRFPKIRKILEKDFLKIGQDHFN